MGSVGAPLAHAGGWDEALVLLGGPVLVFLVLRYMSRQQPDVDDPADRPDGADADGTSPGPPGDDLT